LQLDLIVISGDLTQRATHDEFQQAHDFLTTLPVRYLVVPGNHDLAAWRLWERFTAPWKKWKRYIAPELDTCAAGPGFIAVGLNTARRFGTHPDWSRGRVNHRQLRWMQRQFDKHPPETLRILVTHHPFYLSAAAQGRGLLGRLDQAWPILQASSADLLLSGHLHLAYAQSVNGMVIAQAGTGISDRLKGGEANSFNLITANEKQIVLQNMLWSEANFMAQPPQIFENGAQGWQKHVLSPDAA